VTTLSLLDQFVIKRNPMPQSHERATRVADIAATPAVDLMGDGVNPRQLRSTGLSSIRRWVLWAGLALAVTFVTAGAFLLASTGNGSHATDPGGSAARPAVSNHNPSAADSGTAHRQSPIRRTSPHA
jgi:hypothetical protein